MSGTCAPGQSVKDHALEVAVAARGCGSARRLRAPDSSREEEWGSMCVLGRHAAGTPPVAVVAALCTGTAARRTLACPWRGGRALSRASLLNVARHQHRSPPASLAACAARCQPALAISAPSDAYAAQLVSTAARASPTPLSPPRAGGLHGRGRVRAHVEAIQDGAQRRQVVRVRVVQAGDARRRDDSKVRRHAAQCSAAHVGAAAAQ